MLAALNSISVLGQGVFVQPLLGQINLQGGFPVILGLCLAGAGAGLYLLRSMRPEVARDYDIFFSAISLLCGGILLFNGWRLDPILMFGQTLMSGSAVFFALESIRLRSITNDQARRGMGGGGSRPIVDDERSYDVDQVYRAELDEIEPFMEERPPVRRIRGARDTEDADREAYNSRYRDDSYGRDNYGGDSYGGESSSASRRSSSRRSSRSSRRGSPSYGSDRSYGNNDDAFYRNEKYDSDSYGNSASSSSSDWGYGSSVDSDYSSRRSSRDESSSSSRRASSRRRSDTSNRDRYYEDEAPAPRSSRRRSSRSDRSSSSRPSDDDYVDYKPISSYPSEQSSSSYGSRRPANDYDDEWGS